MNRWTCTAPPGASAMHAGIPDQLVVFTISRARYHAMREVHRALPARYRYLVPQFTYKLEES